MKTGELLGGMLLLGASLLSTSAFADHFHRGYGHGGVRSSFSFYFGSPYRYMAPYPYGYAYPAPYAYYPPVVITQPAPPPLYIEQGQVAPSVQAVPQQAQPSVNTADNYYWHRCDSPSGYYPYVKECPAGWVKEVPSSPNE